MYEGGPQIHTEDFRVEYYKELWPNYEPTLALRNDSGEDCEFLVEFLAVEGAPESLHFANVDAEMSEDDSQYISVWGDPLKRDTLGLECM